jgi:hypothetical protein
MEPLAITNHARTRMQQRSIKMSTVELLLIYGRYCHASGSVRIDLDRCSSRLLAEHFAPAKPPDKIMNTYAVIAGCRLITVGHQTKRFSWN